MTELGDMLAEAREKQGWKLREVEKRTGIHNAHLSQIENGGIERPSLNILWTLSEVYDLDYRQLARLAGHVESEPSAGAIKRSPVGAALRAMGDLTPKDQKEVLQFIKDLKREERADHKGS